MNDPMNDKMKDQMSAKKDNTPDYSADTSARVGPTESGEEISVPHPKKPQFEQNETKQAGGCRCGRK